VLKHSEGEGGDDVGALRVGLCARFPVEEDERVRALRVVCGVAIFPYEGREESSGAEGEGRG
jgi:hypothetical protein